MAVFGPRTRLNGSGGEQVAAVLGVGDGDINDHDKMTDGLSVVGQGQAQSAMPVFNAAVPDESMDDGVPGAFFNYLGMDFSRRSGEVRRFQVIRGLAGHVTAVNSGHHGAPKPVDVAVHVRVNIDHHGRRQQMRGNIENVELPPVAA